jgi:hypothetical protein
MASSSAVVHLTETVGRELIFREDLSTKTEEYPLLETVTRQLLLRTLWAEKDLT